MEVVLSDSAAVFVAARGGVVFVRADQSHCCSGPLTTLKVGTAPPLNSADYVASDVKGIEVKYSGGPSGQPDQLVIELRGKHRPRLAAYWDGCAYKL
jgi:hypothetical protein